MSGRIFGIKFMPENHNFFHLPCITYIDRMMNHLYRLTMKILILFL